MPPTPIVATDRLVFRYTVDGMTHRQTSYFLATASADASGFNAVARPGGTNTGVSNICDAFFEAIKAYYDDADTTFDSMTMEQELGGSWIPVYVKIPTITPTGTGAYQIANGLDCVGKDLAHKTFHAYIYEALTGFSDKATSYASLSATAKKYVDFYYQLGGFVNFEQAWNWRRSRSSSYAQNWLSLVWDTNEKLRRERGIK